MNAQPIIAPENCCLIPSFAGLTFAQQLQDRGYKISGSKGLLEQNAAGNALRFPSVGSRARDVDDRKYRIDLTRGARYFPAIDPAKQSDIGYQRAIATAVAFEESNSLLA